MNEERGRERRGKGEGEAAFPGDAFEREVVDAFERELAGVELCDVESVGQRLSIEVESRRSHWEDLSRDLEVAMGVAGGEALFRRGPRGWELDRPGEELGPADRAQPRRTGTKAGDCVGRLVEDLVEEERVGAWRWRDPTSRPAPSLRLTAACAAGEIELIVKSEQGGRTRFRITAPPGVRDVCLHDRRRDRDLPRTTLDPGVASTSNPGGGVEFALEAEDLGELELRVSFDDQPREQCRVPVAAPREEA